MKTLDEAIQFYRATGEHGYLSNLFKCNVTTDGRTFPSSEHAYQFAKFADKDARDWAMDAPKVHLVCVVAQNLYPWDVVKGWSTKKIDRMRVVLKAKFQQNQELKEKLLATGDATLIENSKTDSYWGIGKSKKGKNMLGILLMELRTELKEIES